MTKHDDRPRFQCWLLFAVLQFISGLVLRTEEVRLQKEMMLVACAATTELIAVCCGRRPGRTRVCPIEVQRSMSTMYSSSLVLENVRCWEVYG